MVTYLLIAVLVVLSILDAVSTLKFLKLGIEEANPLLRYLFSKADPVGVLLAVKSVFIGTVIYFSAYLHDTLEFYVVLGLLNLLYTAIVYWNFKLIREHS